MKVTISKTYELSNDDIKKLKNLYRFGHSWNHEFEMDGLVQIGLANEDNLNGKVTLNSDGKKVLEELNKNE